MRLQKVIPNPYRICSNMSTRNLILCRLSHKPQEHKTALAKLGRQKQTKTKPNKTQLKSRTSRTASHTVYTFAFFPRQAERTKFKQYEYTQKKRTGKIILHRVANIFTERAPQHLRQRCLVRRRRVWIIFLCLLVFCSFDSHRYITLHSIVFDVRVEHNFPYRRRRIVRYL